MRCSPTSWAVHGIDGPIRAIVDVTVEPLSDSAQARVTIEVDFEGHGTSERCKTHFGEFAPIMALDFPAMTSPETQQLLGGQPTHPGLIGNSESLIYDL